MQSKRYICLNNNIYLIKKLNNVIPLFAVFVEGRYMLPRALENKQGKKKRNK